MFDKDKIIIVDQATDKILPIIEEILPKIENNKIYLFADILEKKSKLRNFFEKEIIVELFLVIMTTK